MKTRGVAATRISVISQTLKENRNTVTDQSLCGMTAHHETPETSTRTAAPAVNLNTGQRHIPMTADIRTLEITDAMKALQSATNTVTVTDSTTLSAALLCEHTRSSFMVKLASILKSGSSICF